MRITGGLLLVCLVIGIGILPSCLNNYLRYYMDDAINVSMPGYHVDIRRLKLRPRTLFVDLDDNTFSEIGSLPNSCKRDDVRIVSQALS
jgi:hypothetical protein